VNVKAFYHSVIAPATRSIIPRGGPLSLFPVAFCQNTFYELTAAGTAPDLHRIPY